jgi:farnesyl diphosphate synthase/geranylgeranyl diphosphate synthase type II
MAHSTSSTLVRDAEAVGWATDRGAIDRALSGLCDRHGGALGEPVARAVRYSLLGGGKRLRGLLFLAAYRTAGGVLDASDLAAAIEVVHAYSLVHDDLPCMDDDDLRRGRPTVHRVFGVATATVAGVAMVPLAVRAALDAADGLAVPRGVAAQIVAVLMRASGAGGMIGGQLLDLAAEGRAVDLTELEAIHRAKTGALIRASTTIGGLAAGADVDRIEALDRFGSAIGLAFQIADDVLDVTASSTTLGKPAGRDVDLRKGTYPALLGIEPARRRASELVNEGCEALRAAGLLSTRLEALARFVIERQS